MIRRNSNQILSLSMVSLIYVIFLLQDAMVNGEVHIFTYVDEIAATVCIVIIFCDFLFKHFVISISRIESKIIILYFLFVLIGVVSNIVGSSQNILYIVLDMLTCSKFILGLFCAKVIFRRGVSIEIKKCLRWITRVYIIVIFSLSVHDWFMKPIFKVLYDSVSSGFSTKALCLFYSNATYLAAYAIIALIILIYTKEKNDRLFYVYVGLCFFVIFTTTRSKSWSFLCITILIYMLTLDVSKKKSLKQRLLIIIPAGCLAAVLVAWNKIILYFFTPSHYSPRSILLQGGIAIAKECFPLGSGFGTYCSLAAVLTNKGIDVLRYSTAYYDNFWACMIGQFGFIGTVLYIAMIICVIADIMFLFQNENKNLWYVAIFAILYLLIASLGESSFFSQYSLGYGFVIGLSLSSGLDRMT